MSLLHVYNYFENKAAGHAKVPVVAMPIKNAWSKLPLVTEQLLQLPDKNACSNIITAPAPQWECLWYKQLQLPGKNVCGINSSSSLIRMPVVQTAPTPW